MCSRAHTVRDDVLPQSLLQLSVVVTAKTYRTLAHIAPGLLCSCCGFLIRFALFLAAVGFLSVSRVVDFYEFDIFELSCEAT